MSIRPIITGVSSDGDATPTDAYGICTNTDLESVPGYLNGVITVATGTTLTLDFRCSPITLPDFVLEGTAEVRLRSNLAKATLLYTNDSGTLISGQGIRFSIFNVEIVCTASSATFIDTFNCTLNLDGCAIAGFDNLGDMTGTGLTAFDLSGARSFVDDFAVGLNLNNMVVNSDVLVLTSFRLVGAAINIRNDIPLPLVSSFVNAITFLRPQNSVFKIDPVSTNNFKMSVSLVQSNGGESLFDNTSDASGTFISVADGSVSLGIASVADNGDSKARFTLSSGDVYIGQTVTISGYTTNTNYNGTFIVSDVPVAGAFVVNVDYGTDESGGQVDSSVLTLTETGTTITDGLSITISTDNALTYDGGKVAFNVQANTFQINGVFNGTTSGKWDSANLDQTSPNILASNNPGFMSSTVKTELKSNGNALLTTIPAVDAVVLINSTSWVDDSSERLKSDSNGGVIYSGLESVTLKNDGNLYLRPNSGNNIFLKCQFARQDAQRNSCTFSAINNAVVTLSDHGLSVGDNVTFNDTDGIIDTSLRSDVIYYVESILSSTEFTLSYTSGGYLITLTGVASGNTSFARADLHGSEPIEPIGSGRPRSLVPQAVEDVSTGDKTHLTISNTTNTESINVIDAYYRVSI